MTVKRRSLLAGAGAVTAAPLLAASAPAYAGDDERGWWHRRVVTGAQTLADSGWAELAGRKVGVVTNPTGVLDDTLRSVVDEMVAAGVVPKAVFGPEHGFRGTGQAGDGEGDHVDPRTGVMVYDAHGATSVKLATLYQRAGVDTVVFDIQDVGARFYTYIWTMWEAMKAAVVTGARFVVLDRPNPIGGAARGPLLRPGFTSGVGKKEIIQQHGMTVGELARFYNGELLPADGGPLADLQVIKVRGWRRDTLYADTGLPWVLPSPNMSTPNTALLYPGTCLFEATNMSEGRGTTRPFELIGAPYADYRWAEALNAKGLRGVEFREAYFTPTFSKHVGKVCRGLQVHITDPSRVEAITVATHMIVEAKRLYPDPATGFDWRPGDNPHGRWIDLLTGSDRFKLMLAAGASAEEIVGAWRDELRDFDRRRRPYLLYPGGDR